MTTLFRFLMGIGIVGLFAMSGRIQLEFINNRGLFVRGILGGVSTAIFFLSISRIGLIKAGFIACTYPAFAALFGQIILKERLSPLQWLSIGGSLAGIGLLMGGAAGGFFRAIGPFELLALAGAMLSGLTIVSIKKLQATDSTSAIFFAQCLVGSLVVFIPASMAPVHIVPGTLGILLTIGVLSTVGQLLMTSGYRHISVATGSLLVMTAPVLNCMAGKLLFHEPFSLLMAAGAVVILGSSAGVFFEKE
jgi:drug/metabolite transporter (DMT)-like permease